MKDKRQVPIAETMDCATCTSEVAKLMDVNLKD